MQRKRRFEKGSADTGRFWEIKLMALTQTVWQGRIGEKVSAKVKTYSSVAAAAKAYTSLVGKRLSMGYREVQKASVPTRKAKPKKRPKQKTPTEWYHDVFGLLSRSHGLDSLWERTIELTIFGQVRELQLAVNGNYAEGFDTIQQDAYKRFTRKHKSLLRAAEKALFDYYQENCEDYRDQFEEFADEWAPIVETRSEFARIVEPSSLCFPWATSSRTVGLLLECTWDTSHGLAVKFVDEEVAEVGSQDIVI
jgi:predicted DNA-binding WGR domain protein